MNDLRCFFEKTDTACFMSHLDMMRSFSRAIFASGLPVWFTEGFHPHPYMVFGQPLPLGMAGKREFLDIKLTLEISTNQIIEKLNQHLPYGIKIIDAGTPLNKPKEIMLASFTSVLDAQYKDLLLNLWGNETFITQKKSKSGFKEIDLKKEIHSLQITSTQNHITVDTVMTCTVDGAVTPITLINALQTASNKEIFARHSRNCFYLEGMKNFK